MQRRSLYWNKTLPWLSISGMEIITPEYRSMTVCAARIVFSSGALVVTGAAYFIKDFRTLQLALLVPLVASFSLKWSVCFDYLFVRWNNRNGKVVIVTALVATGHLEVYLQSLQWRAGQSSWWLLRFSDRPCCHRLDEVHWSSIISSARCIYGRSKGTSL